MRRIVKIRRESTDLRGIFPSQHQPLALSLLPLLLRLTLSPMDAMAMGFDHNSPFDHLAVFAPILLILVTCLTVFHRLKARWPVKVNCWFCNENSKIRRQNLDWWLCPWCQQHNGFSKNGDYMYDIPEQYTTSNSFTRYCKLSNQSDTSRILTSNLCTYCNQKESLKLLELSNFESKSEKRYDAELKTFKKYLEDRYPLCDNCKLTVQNVLHKQTLWLTRYKMLFFRQRPIKMLGNSRKLGTICRIIPMILILIIAYSPNYIWLPIIGLLLHLYACYTSSTKRRNYDILLIFLWLLVFSLVSIRSSKIYQNVWLTTEHIAQYHMITACAFIVTFITLKSNLYKSTLTGSVVLKKLKSNSRDATMLGFTYDDQSKNDNVSNKMDNNIGSSVCVTGIEVKSHSAILKQKLFTIAASNSNINYNISPTNASNSRNGCCLNDGLSSLFLSEDMPGGCGRSVRTTPAIFERRVYSATSSENLFRRCGNAYNRRYVLSPPKLRTVNQASWVAGGYWQEGMMTATPLTLSRSSSQSSGFGSAGSSNHAPSSREPSVHEFDRCSVVSDAATRRSSRPYPPNIARNDSPVPRAPWSHAWYPPSSVRDVDDRLTECNRVRVSGVGNADDSLPASFHGGHNATAMTTTIVATPGWLSALLCGSLILNMIVLCTTLLR